MIETFIATLNPMLSFFICIMIGFVLKKTGILPDNAGTVISKLVAWVLYPALCFSSMARYFTVETLTAHVSNLTVFTISLVPSIGISILLSYAFVKEKSYNRCVYQYALAFANSGYMGDPLVQALFGDETLSYYKLACLPISIAIYTWGVSRLVPSDKNKKSLWKKLLNGPIVGMFLGMIVGLITGAVLPNVDASTTAYDLLIPSFIVSTIDSLKVCMGPMAMIVAGVTIAKYDLLKMFKKKRVYFATALRLIILPVVILSALFGIKELINLILNTTIDNTPILLLFFAIAAPLGLNTIIFPEAYGGDPEEGASMALISHTLCIITIPLMFALANLLLGQNAQLPV